MSYTPPYSRDAPKKRPEARSWDRVHFTIRPIYLLKKDIRLCLHETLGISMDATLSLGKQCKDLHIVCRPSQFARFIILRHIKYGEPNNMADLNMQLVVPPPQVDAPWDVSGHPNTAGEALLPD